MNSKRMWMVGLVLLLAVALAACNRSRGSGVGAAPTQAGGTAATGPQGTSDLMQELTLFVTQTAMAGGGQAVGMETPVAPLPTDVNILPVPTDANTVDPNAGGGLATPPVVEAQVPTPTIGAPVEALPTVPAIVVPTATPGLPATYTLQGGEFVFCIARRFNINPADLLNANGLGANTVLNPGYTLTIPSNPRPYEGPRALRSHPTTYTVSSGETLNSIACLFGDVDPNAIAFANGLTAPVALTPGQVLQIP